MMFRNFTYTFQIQHVHLAQNVRCSVSANNTSRQFRYPIILLIIGFARIKLTSVSLPRRMYLALPHREPRIVAASAHASTPTSQLTDHGNQKYAEKPEPYFPSHKHAGSTAQYGFTAPARTINRDTFALSKGDNGGGQKGAETT